MAKNGMSDLEMLPEHVNAIEHKLDALAVSVDRRFDEVTQALVEQREYTEFAFTQLDAKMTSGFARVEIRLEGFDHKLQGVEHKLERVERKIDQLIIAGTKRPRRRPRRR